MKKNTITLDNNEYLNALKKSKYEYEYYNKTNHPEYKKILIEIIRINNED